MRCSACSSISQPSANVLFLELAGDVMGKPFVSFHREQNCERGI
jgi:hypothetical protein